MRLLDEATVVSVLKSRRQSHMKSNVRDLQFRRRFLPLLLLLSPIGKGQKKRSGELKEMMAPAFFPCMFFFLSSFFALRCFGGPIFTEFIRPNFTATNLGFVDNNDVFLAFKSNIFRASICNPAGNGFSY
ncbi:uncharacterized protein LOC126410699 [Nymphaea colorata]|uniref:uncharacterized protein LOC126410699 n=1 Tax=Nymphaea colorata TaxID=210225 RepID=UPI00214EDBA3|nr:uncharacterized protein LOC126410699 [Nymphaea colorata]